MIEAVPSGLLNSLLLLSSIRAFFFRPRSPLCPSRYTDLYNEYQALFEKEIEGERTQPTDIEYNDTSLPGPGFTSATERSLSSL